MAEYESYLSSGYDYGRDNEYMQEEDTYWSAPLATVDQGEFYEGHTLGDDYTEPIVLGNQGNTVQGYAASLPAYGGEVYEVATGYYDPGMQSTTDWDLWFGEGGGGEGIEEFVPEVEETVELEPPSEGGFSFGWPDLSLPDFSLPAEWFDDEPDPQYQEEGGYWADPLWPGHQEEAEDFVPFYSEGEFDIIPDDGGTMAKVMVGIMAAVVPLMIIMPMMGSMFGARR